MATKTTTTKAAGKTATKTVEATEPVTVTPEEGRALALAQLDGDIEGDGALTGDLLPSRADEQIRIQMRYMDLATRFAEQLARAPICPTHLKAADLEQTIANCWLVAYDALRWQEDPLSNARVSYVLNNKLAYEAKLIIARVNRQPDMDGPLSFAVEGDESKPETLSVICTGTLIIGRDEDGTPRTRPPDPIRAKFEDWKMYDRDGKNLTNAWRRQPAQQLRYRSALMWARANMPRVVIGVLSREEANDLEASGEMRDITPRANAAERPRLVHDSDVVDKPVAARDAEPAIEIEEAEADDQNDDAESAAQETEADGAEEAETNEGQETEADGTQETVTTGSKTRPMPCVLDEYGQPIEGAEFIEIEDARDIFVNRVDELWQGGKGAPEAVQTIWEMNAELVDQIHEHMGDEWLSGYDDMYRDAISILSGNTEPAKEKKAEPPVETGRGWAIKIKVVSGAPDWNAFYKDAAAAVKQIDQAVNLEAFYKANIDNLRELEKARPGQAKMLREAITAKGARLREASTK